MTSGNGRQGLPNIRLGLLDAFVAFAEFLSYEEAGKKLGLSSKQVWRNVMSLEASLRRVLVSDKEPPEIYRLGKRYVDYTRGFLEKVDGLSRPRTTAAGDRSQKLKRSAVNVEQIQTFLELARHQSYKCISDDENEVKAARDTIKRLEQAFGCNLFRGRGKLELTEAGRSLHELATNPR